jgi:PBP1b-binding outer membrane lipoprotein LpoB
VLNERRIKTMKKTLLAILLGVTLLTGCGSKEMETKESNNTIISENVIHENILHENIIEEIRD